jgi:hypothetical protein
MYKNHIKDFINNKDISKNRVFIYILTMDELKHENEQSFIQ